MQKHVNKNAENEKSIKFRYIIYAHDALLEYPSSA